MKIQAATAKKPFPIKNRLGSIPLCIYLTWIVAFSTILVAAEPRDPVKLPGLKCKYSVRDVGFVNVHAFDVSVDSAAQE